VQQVSIVLVTIQKILASSVMQVSLNKVMHATRVASPNVHKVNIVLQGRSKVVPGSLIVLLEDTVQKDQRPIQKNVMLALFVTKILLMVKVVIKQIVMCASVKLDTTVLPVRDQPNRVSVLLVTTVQKVQQHNRNVPRMPKNGSANIV
jgi:hypothetical protein